MDQTTYRLRRRSFLVVSILLMASLLAPAGSEAGASGTGSGSAEGASTESTWACTAGNLAGHSRPYLTGFTALSPASPFYAAPEHQNVTSTITVTVVNLCGDGVAEGSQVTYQTQDGSADDGDYTAAGGTTPTLCLEDPDTPPHFPCRQPSQESFPVLIDLKEDTPPPDEPAVESLLFRLTSSTPFPLATHRFTEAPVHIIDNDGPNRVSLEPTLDGNSTMSYARGEPSVVRIPVFWAGPGTPSAPVDYTVAPGTPSPTVGVDYEVLSDDPLQPGDFTHAGDRLAFIEIKILNNAGPDGKPAKELDEVISIQLDPGAGYSVEAAHDSTTLTILDGGSDTLAPRTRFHHPKHKKKYRRNAYQLREIHIFYREPGGSGIKKVQLAIQRKLKNGKCQWWNGKRFRRGRCKKVPGRFWKKAKYDRFLDWYLYRVPAFKPTVRTNIRYYRAFARGFDHAGNVETRFQKNRNKNKFWIKRR